MRPPKTSAATGSAGFFAMLAVEVIAPRLPAPALAPAGPPALKEGRLGARGVLGGAAAVEDEPGPLSFLAGAGEGPEDMLRLCR